MESNICSLNKDSKTCLPDSTIKTLSKSFLPEEANGETSIIISKLSTKMKCENSSSKENELCILNSIKNKTADDNLKNAINKQILKFFKIPTKSLDSNYWLNNTEIDNVQFQFQTQYPGYYYSTIHMIDLENFSPSNANLILNNDKIFNIRDINFVDELNQNSNAKLIYNGKLKNFGIVCNTDLSTNRGIHWFSIFINFPENSLFNKQPITIEYFNSSGYPLTKGTHQNEREKFYTYFKNLSDDLTKEGFSAEFIQVTDIEHQRADTANCGSYSLYYIWCRLNGRAFEELTKNRITDEEMEKFRSVLWRQE